MAALAMLMAMPDMPIKQSEIPGYYLQIIHLVNMVGSVNIPGKFMDDRPRLARISCYFAIKQLSEAERMEYLAGYEKREKECDEEMEAVIQETKKFIQREKQRQKETDAAMEEIKQLQGGEKLKSELKPRRDIKELNMEFRRLDGLMEEENEKIEVILKRWEKLGLVEGTERKGDVKLNQNPVDADLKTPKSATTDSDSSSPPVEDPLAEEKELKAHLLKKNSRPDLVDALLRGFQGNAARRQIPFDLKEFNVLVSKHVRLTIAYDELADQSSEVGKKLAKDLENSSSLLDNYIKEGRLS